MEKISQDTINSNNNIIYAIVMYRHKTKKEIISDLLSVGAAGFEPATSCSQSRRDTGLRYAPNPLNISLCCHRFRCLGLQR